MKILSSSVLLTIIVGVASLGLVNKAEAKAEVEINWENPEKYRDVRSTNQSRKKFREATFKRIEEYVNKLAIVIPEGKRLVLTVSDLDLAGRVWPASFVGFGHSGADVRLIKRIDIPRIDFSYQLYDQTGNLIKESRVNLKDMAFMERSNRFFRSETLRYEKNMLKTWFNKEFSHYLDVNNDETEANTQV